MIGEGRVWYVVERHGIHGRVYSVTFGRRVDDCGMWWENAMM